ncbi:hypothetical protein BGZ83_002797 [Gryganskiella cystojenkinii]|nr:hypothetical protein BGZ83_002797 [Gryganskiella cystojenkinii]
MSVVPSKDAITSAALNWIISDMPPFSVLDSDDFKALVRLYQRKYTIPCARTVSEALPDHRLAVAHRLKKLLNASFVSGYMTIDNWTSDSGKPFMSLTLQWLDPNFNFHECGLAPSTYARRCCWLSPRTHLQPLPFRLFSARHWKAKQQCSQ